MFSEGGLQWHLDWNVLKLNATNLSNTCLSLTYPGALGVTAYNFRDFHIQQRTIISNMLYILQSSWLGIGRALVDKCHSRYSWVEPTMHCLHRKVTSQTQV